MPFRTTQLTQNFYYNVGPLNDILKEKLNKVNKIVEKYRRQFNVSPLLSFVKESYYAEATKMIQDPDVKT